MKRRRWVFRGLVLPLLAVVWMACTDGHPTDVAEVATPDQGLVGSLLQPTGLLQCRPLPHASTTVTIGPAGGVIEVGVHRLTVPPGALPHPVTITAHAPRGPVNVVEFSPHGLEFNRAATLTMSYANCNTFGLLIPKRIAYTDGRLNILEYIPSIDDLSRQLVDGRLDHFSGYALAW